MLRIRNNLKGHAREVVDASAAIAFVFSYSKRFYLDSRVTLTIMFEVHKFDHKTTVLNDVEAQGVDLNS